MARALDSAAKCCEVAGRAMGADETIERFFRCPECRLPHAVGTAQCPVTGNALAERASREARSLDKTIRHGGSGEVARDFRQALLGKRLVDNKYEIVAEIGAGAMGTVYEARHVLLGRTVAIKAMGELHRSRADMARRFMAEGRVLASITHPHVVHIYDLGALGETPYLVMERLRGVTLDEHLERNGPLSVEDAGVVVRQILSGLAVVHQLGIVHRDLKPANIFLVESKDGAPRVKLLDFGVSTALVPGDDSDEQPGQIIGTPAYLAPEQARGEVVDARADLWAVGVCLHQMLTGERPFNAESLNGLILAIVDDEPAPPSALVPSIPAALDRVVLRALAKNREDRFPSALAMLDALAAPADVEVRESDAPDLALVVESDPSLAEAYAAVARDLGLTPIHAGDGLEARELVASIGLPRLLMLNLTLACLDGFALLRDLGPPSARPEVGVLALSPVSEFRAAARARAAELGISAILDNRVPRSVLQSVARRVLEAPDGAPPSSVSVVDAAPPPPELDEARRLAKIDAMKIVDAAPPERALQGLVEEAARALDVPIALVSLVLQDRQWFKASVGLEGDLLAQRGTPKSWSFCRHVVETGAPLVVPDARTHPTFADNPLVVNGVVGSYAGAPLVTPSGEVVGTLCIIDHQKSAMAQHKLDELMLLARRVAGELELEGTRRTAPAILDKPGTGSTKQRLTTILANLDCALLLLDPGRKIVFANEALGQLAGAPVDQLSGLARDAFLERFSARFPDPADFLRRTRVLATGPFAASHDFVMNEPVRTTLRWNAKPVEVGDGIGQLETFVEIRG